MDGRSLQGDGLTDVSRQRGSWRYSHAQGRVDIHEDLVQADPRRRNPEAAVRDQDRVCGRRSEGAGGEGLRRLPWHSAIAERACVPLVGVGRSAVRGLGSQVDRLAAVDSRGRRRDLSRQGRVHFERHGASRCILRRGGAVDYHSAVVGAGRRRSERDCYRRRSEASAWVRPVSGHQRRVGRARGAGAAVQGDLEGRGSSGPRDRCRDVRQGRLPRVNRPSGQGHAGG